MLYHIQGYAPRCEIGQAGFNVLLWPAFKEAVAAYEPQLTQANINRAIERMGDTWLDGHGYSRKYDPDDNRPAFQR